MQLDYYPELPIKITCPNGHIFESYMLRATVTADGEAVGILPPSAYLCDVCDAEIADDAPITHS